MPPGPIPKRTEERRRNNKDVVGVETVNLDELIKLDVEVPEIPTHVDKDGEVVDSWHPTAVAWYESLAKSGQSVFYEPSDWMTAYVLAETLSRELAPQPIVLTNDVGETHIEWIHAPIKGASLTAILKGMSSLMTSEGERRRLRIELDRRNATDKKIEDTPQLTIVQNRDELLG